MSILIPALILFGKKRKLSKKEQKASDRYWDNFLREPKISKAEEKEQLIATIMLLTLPIWVTIIGFSVLELCGLFELIFTGNHEIFKATLRFLMELPNHY